MDKASWEREAMRVWGIALEIRLRGAYSKKAINEADQALAAWKKQFPMPSATAASKRTQEK